MGAVGTIVSGNNDHDKRDVVNASRNKIHVLGLGTSLNFRNK